MSAWFEHRNGDPRPVSPDTMVRVYWYRNFFEELEAEKLASHIQKAASVDWEHRPGEKLKYQIVRKSDEEIAAELRVRDMAPELLAKLADVAKRGDNYDGNDWALFVEECQALVAKARAAQ